MSSDEYVLISFSSFKLTQLTDLDLLMSCFDVGSIWVWIPQKETPEIGSWPLEGVKILGAENREGGESCVGAGTCGGDRGL